MVPGVGVPCLPQPTAKQPQTSCRQHRVRLWPLLAAFLGPAEVPLAAAGVTWEPGLRPPYSETSDSCERYFSNISVILITWPLPFFFFRVGPLETPDLEAAAGHREGGGRESATG